MNNVTQAEWQNSHGKNPHERLDTFVKLWGEHQEWASGIDAKLTQLTERLAPDVAHADAIVESMMAAEIVQTTKSVEMVKLQEEIAYIRMNILDMKDGLAEIEAEIALSATGKNADERKSNQLIARKSNEQYQDARRLLRDAEKEKLVKQALYDSAEREYKRLGEQLRNLRARLEHWTARARMIGE